MILSRGRRYLFIHIPKTGGTSLALALEARAMADDQMLGDTPKARNRRGRLKGMRTAGRLWKHSTLRDLEGLITLADLEDLMVVTLVRNPWDRLVSYFHWLRAQSFDHPAVQLAQSQTFAAFLAHPQTQASLRANSYGSYVIDWAGRDRGTLFLRLEHLSQDLAPFEAHLGFELDVPHENRSDRSSDYRSYYTDSSAALVADLCAEDIQRFGYSFDPN